MDINFIFVLFVVMELLFIVLDTLFDYRASNYIEKYIKEKKMKNEKPFSYRLGHFFGSVIFGCLCAVVIAMTIKFIMWMF